MNVGGVATFTPRALYEDPNAVRDLFDEIEQHPLWVGYVLPSSIGIAAKIVAGSEDPMVAFERCERLMSISQSEAHICRRHQIEFSPSPNSERHRRWEDSASHFSSRPEFLFRNRASRMDQKIFYSPSIWPP